MRRTLLRTLGWLAVLAAFAGAALLYVRWKRANTPEIPRFKTVKVERGDVAAKVTATGTLSARVTVQVGTQVSGRIAEILVDFNSPVKKDQVVAKLDTRVLQAAVQKARAAWVESKASVGKAKANLAQAQRNYDRNKGLREQGLLGQADLELSETALLGAKADVAVAEGRLASTAATLNEAQVNLGFATIYSPIDGVVLSRDVDVGQTVAASLQAPVLFTIAQDLRSIQVDTFVAEADVGKLEAGMAATFTVDAYPGRKFHGKVREVRNAAQTVQNVVTYDAVLDVNNEALELKPGMTANVTFVWAERGSALKVPNAALRFRMPPEALEPKGEKDRSGKGPRPAGSGSAHPFKAGAGAAGGDADKRQVWILRDGKPRPARVEVGITDGTTTEIVSGHLQEGDEVITEYVAPSGGGAPAKPGGGAPRRMF